MADNTTPQNPPQRTTKPTQLTNGHWLKDTVTLLTDGGWRCLPAGLVKGRLQPLVPWKRDNNWYLPDHPKWRDPVVSMIAIQPPYNVVFLDADCYKDGAATWLDLEKLLGIAVEFSLFQKSLEKDSYHFVFRVPDDHNIKNCADSIPQLPHLDVRTTDGLIYVKPSKQLFACGLSDLLDMPSQLLDLMPRNDSDRLYRGSNTQALRHSGTGLCDYLQSKGYQYRGENGGAQTFDHPESHSQSSGVRVMLVDGVEKVWSFQSDPLGDEHWHDLASAIALLEPCDNGLAYKAVQLAEGDWRRALDLLPEITRQREQKRQVTEPPADHPALSAPNLDEFSDDPAVHEEVKKKTLFQLIPSFEGFDVDVDWYIKGFLPANSFGLLFGESESFKSFHAISWACHVATGKDWDGKKVTKAPVLLIAGEGGIGVPRRIKAWANRYNKGRDIPTLWRVPFAVIFNELAQMQCLTRTIRHYEEIIGQKFGLIIIDTLARCFGNADENSTQDMNAFIASCDRLKADIGASVAVVHHTGVNAKERARGSSALNAALDFEYKIERKNKDQLFFDLINTKMKDHEKVNSRRFLLTSEFLRYDRDNDAVSALVCADTGSEVIDLATGDDEELFRDLSKAQQSVYQIVRSRMAQGESTDSKIVLDDYKAQGGQQKNFSRTVSQLLKRGVLTKKNNDLIAKVSQ